MYGSGRQYKPVLPAHAISIHRATIQDRQTQYHFWPTCLSHILKAKLWLTTCANIPNTQMHTYKDKHSTHCSTGTWGNELRCSIYSLHIPHSTFLIPVQCSRQAGILELELPQAQEPLGNAVSQLVLLCSFCSSIMAARNSAPQYAGTVEQAKEAVDGLVLDIKVMYTLS